MLRLNYLDGRGVLRTAHPRSVRRVMVDREATTADGHREATVTLQLTGRGDLTALAAELTELRGVRAARTGADAGLDEE